MSTRTQRFLVALVAGGFVMLAGCSHKAPSTSATAAPGSSTASTPPATPATPATTGTSSGTSNSNGTSSQKSAPMNACGQSKGS